MGSVLRGAFGAVILGAAIAARAWAGGEGLEPGVVLNQQTWKLAEGLLPPEILKHYENGEYANPIVPFPEELYRWPPDFLAASKSNEGKFDIGANGEIIEKATGQQPPYIMGFPFPTVDPADPKAAAKAIWNFFYRTWYFGNVRVQTQLNWIGQRGLERRADTDVNFLFYDGVPSDERLDNPQDFLSQQLTVVLGPADLQGTAALTWRYRDSAKRDSAWSFVPALRRVRQVSPANRSDGFLGSDMSQDDGPFFDGKPEDFNWTLKGEVEQLRFVDPLNLKGLSDNVFIDGVWRSNWPADLKTVGYMDGTWTGIPWASISGALAKRRFLVIEAVPKDNYYLYGKLELYVDSVTFQGAWNRKFSWKGKLLNTLQVMAYNPIKVTNPAGKVDYLQGGNMAYQCAESIAANRATVAGIKISPTSLFDARIKFDPALFDMNSLSRYGK